MVLVEGREAQRRRLADPELVDIARHDLGLDGQAIAVGHDLHDHLAVDLVDVGAELEVVLEHLDIDLDLALSLRQGRRQLAALAIEPRRFAFHGGQAVDRDQPLLPQRACAGQFLLDERDFLRLSIRLRRVPAISFCSCGIRCCSWALLAGKTRTACLENLLLAGHDVEERWIAAAIPAACRP
ncbi:hypothetical protein NKJ86_27755 [Mesorhizobium sp. M0025]|uniref:hypothetical protein n=1 Tax=Mesorhizobium sp. M0025 TaxID=2956846 RepID=UPI0033358D59